MNFAVYNAGRVKRGLACCGLKPRGMGDDATDAGNYLMDSGGGYFDYYDSAYGVYYDEYGNPWQVADIYGTTYGGGQDLTADGYDANGNVVLQISTDTQGNPTGDVNLASLGKTWDWIETNGGAPVRLPNVSLPYSYILQIPDSGIIPPGLYLPPVVNALPPSVLAKIKAALAKVAKNVSMSAGTGSGAAAGGRPAAVQPNAQGQCPAGYQKTAAGQCALVSASPAPNATTGFLNNPLFLLLAALGLIMLAKR